MWLCPRGPTYTAWEVLVGVPPNNHPEWWSSQGEGGVRLSMCNVYIIYVYIYTSISILYLSIYHLFIYLSSYYLSFFSLSLPIIYYLSLHPILASQWMLGVFKVLQNIWSELMLLYKNYTSSLPEKLLLQSSNLLRRFYTIEWHFNPFLRHAHTCILKSDNC
jgi:hypothetical protein